MTLNRKIVIFAAVLVGIGLGAATAYAQTKCQHIGQWSRVDGRWVCSGDYTSGQCVWYDDCRVNVD